MANTDDFEPLLESEEGSTAEEPYIKQLRTTAPGESGLNCLCVKRLFRLIRLGFGSWKSTNSLTFYAIVLLNIALGGGLSAFTLFGGLFAEVLFSPMPQEDREVAILRFLFVGFLGYTVIGVVMTFTQYLGASVAMELTQAVTQSCCSLLRVYPSFELAPHPNSEFA